MNTFLLEQTVLQGNLNSIVSALNVLMNDVWTYVLIALSAIVVVWGAYVGIRIAIARKNEDKINAREMVKSLLIGILVIFVIGMGAPLLIEGLTSWANVTLIA